MALDACAGAVVEGRAGVRVVFICEAVDAADPMQPTTIRWLEALAGHPAVARVTAITLRRGEHHLPAHVTVRDLGRGGRLRRLARFWVEAVRAARAGADCFFVYQGGHYPLLLLPFRLALGTPVYQWWAHPRVGLTTRLYARFCDDKVFTSTPGAFPVPLPKVRVVGQGIDTERFRMIPGRPKSARWVTVGRISPVKRLDAMLRALGECNRRFGTRQGLDLYGPTPAGQDGHHAALEQIVREECLDGLVTFHGQVRQEQLPDILNDHPVFVHFCDGALDKTTVEAMACGLPVLSTNACVGEVVPGDLRPDLMLAFDDVGAQAEKMRAAIAWDEARRAAIGTRLRAVAVEGHGVVGLFDRLVREMTTCDVEPASGYRREARVPSSPGASA